MASCATELASLSPSPHSSMALRASARPFQSRRPTDPRTGNAARFAPPPPTSGFTPTAYRHPSIRLAPSGRPVSVRHSTRAAAVPPAVSQSTKPIRLTYLEGNSWLWDVGGLSILVDPILVGNLDFGLPWLYDAAKKVLRNFRLEDLPEIDCLLITQSLDDHCHIKTLSRLSKMLPDLPVIATPNAEPKLSLLFGNVTFLEPGESSEIEEKSGGKVNVFATAGPTLGPPWQRPENGYIITYGQSQLTLYYEPHCVYNHSFLQNYQADIIITPVIKQLLPAFTLVSGQEDAVQLAKLLQSKYIIPMKNGDLDAKGILSSILYAEGTVESFKELLSRELPDACVLEPTPGVPLEIPVPLRVP